MPQHLPDCRFSNRREHTTCTDTDKYRDGSRALAEMANIIIGLYVLIAPPLNDAGEQRIRSIFGTAMKRGNDNNKTLRCVV